MSEARVASPYGDAVVADNGRRQDGRGVEMRRRMIAVLAILPLVGCGGPASVVDVGNAPTRGGEATVAVEAGRPDDTRRTPETGDPVPDDGRPSAPDQDSGGEPAVTDTTTVVVYLTQDEQITALPRTVPRVPRIGTVTLQQLLAGPTADERAAGYGTEIPPSTRLRGLTITDGVAVVDLSGDFESGGGTLGLTLRLAQVACTLDQFPTVDGVRFALDGTVVDVFSGDGLIIDEPVGCGDYADVVAE